MQRTTPKSNWLLRLHQNHERLKTFVHQGMRYPLPRWGQRLMGFVYFTIPVIGGWYVMQWAIGKSHASIGPNGERLPNRHDAVGTVPQPAVNIGVAPAKSVDQEQQLRNKKKLERFLRKQFQKQNEEQQQPEKK